MLTLHYLNDSRAQRIVWLLEELNLEYVLEMYQRDEKTMLAPRELEKIHPLGKSPVLQDGQKVIAESAVIVDYLINQYSHDLYKPTMAQAEYWDYQYWLHYPESSLMPPLLLRLVFETIKARPVPFFVKPIVKAIAAKVTEAFIGPNIKRNMQFVEGQLENKTWMLNEQLSGADILLSFPLEGSASRGVISEQDYPNIFAYVRRCQQRDAYQRALKKTDDYSYLL